MFITTICFIFTNNLHAIYLKTIGIKTKVMKKNVLSHGDFTKIASLAGLSLSTIQKYFHTNSALSVRPDTELKILEAYKLYLNQQASGLHSYLEKVSDLETRVLQLKQATESSLLTLKAAVNG